MDKRIGFIGAGQMAEALARGFIGKGVCRADQVFATDVVQVRILCCACATGCPGRQPLLPSTLWQRAGLPKDGTLPSRTPVALPSSRQGPST